MTMMTRENTNRTNDQSKTSTGKSFKLNVSDLTPKKDPKGGKGGIHIGLADGSVRFIN
jgi:hypothetical protein